MNICLQCLTNSGYQSWLCEELGVSQSTVSLAISTIVDEIVDKFNYWIKFASSLDETNNSGLGIMVK